MQIHWNLQLSSFQLVKVAQSQNAKLYLLVKKL